MKDLPIKLPTQDSSTGRGLKTTIQAGAGTLIVTAIINLLVSVWNVPGVPDVVLSWLQENIFKIAGSIGVSSGIVAFLWNLPRRDIPNY